MTKQQAASGFNKDKEKRDEIYVYLGQFLAKFQTDYYFTDVILWRSGSLAYSQNYV